MITNKRIGKVQLSTDIIENRPDLAHLIFSKFIPVRAEMLWHLNHIEYIGVSEMFDEIKEGDVVPEYVFECTTIEGGGGAKISGVIKLQP